MAVGRTLLSSGRCRVQQLLRVPNSSYALKEFERGKKSSIREIGIRQAVYSICKSESQVRNLPLWMKRVAGNVSAFMASTTIRAAQNESQFPLIILLNCKYILFRAELVIFAVHNLLVGALQIPVICIEMMARLGQGSQFASYGPESSGQRG